MKFFSEMFDLEDVAFSRSLWPSSDVVGLPILVAFSDGSTTVFGAAA